MSEKVLINILSKEMMPNFIAAMEVTPDRVIALTTPRSKEQVGLFEKMTGIPHESREIDPFDLHTDYERVCGLIGEFSSETEIVLNFTGGTKVMSLATALGCIRLSETRSIELIYVDTERRQMETLKLENGQLIFGKERPLTIPIPLEAYINLAGETMASSQTELSEAGEARRNIARALLGEQYRTFFRMGTIRKTLAENCTEGDLLFPLCDPKGRRSDEQGRLHWDGTGFLLNTGRESMQCACSDSASFFNGTWLEEFAFNACLESRKFDTVTTNIVLSLHPETIEGEQRLPWNRKRSLEVLRDKNEIDLVVTKGPRAALCECKSGQVRQEDIYKLIALKNLLLGRLGVAVLISRLEPSPKIREKMKDCGIRCIQGSALKRLPTALEAYLT